MIPLWCRPVLSLASVIALGLALHAYVLSASDLSAPPQLTADLMAPAEGIFVFDPASESTRPPSSPSPIVLTASQVVARTSWAAAALIFFGAWVAALAVAFTIAAESLPSIQMRVLAGSITAAIGLAAAIGSVASGDRVGFGPPVMREALTLAFARDGLWFVQRFSSAFNGLTLVAVIWITAAFSTLCRRCQDQVSTLTVRLRRLDLLLGVAVLLLVAGVAEIGALYALPAALAHDDVVRQALERIAQSVTLAFGAFFTTMLVALYAPVAVILRTQAREIATRNVSAQKAAVGLTTVSPQAELKDFGINTSPFAEIARFASALAPLLTGTLMQTLLEGLGS